MSRTIFRWSIWDIDIDTTFSPRMRQMKRVEEMAKTAPRERERERWLHIHTWFIHIPIWRKKCKTRIYTLNRIKMNWRGHGGAKTSSNWSEITSSSSYIYRDETITNGKGNSFHISMRKKKSEFSHASHIHALKRYHLYSFCVSRIDEHSTFSQLSDFTVTQKKMETSREYKRILFTRNYCRFLVICGRSARVIRRILQGQAVPAKAIPHSKCMNM